MSIDPVHAAVSGAMAGMPIEMTGLVRAKAIEHGFSLCRITRPAIRPAHVAALHSWLEKGMQGEMAWMAEPVRLQRRMDPVSMLDGVRSVLTLAMRYTAPPCGPDETTVITGCGVISAYAHGDDYHDVMKKRLKALARDLDILLGPYDQRIYVDTVPVLEHALAEAAGLGWQGKHSLTIDRKLGSWFLLGEIFTTAELVPDMAADNHCGRCTACISSCPTGAIVAPYVVDARRCISYLTIEFDGFIPHELRPLMGNRIYGCDDCQMVCPWNGHAAGLAESPEDHLKPRRENHLPELASLLRLDEDGFRRRFAKSPVRRSRRSRLLRNVCIAMGNSGRAAFVPLLLSVLADPEPLIRGHAVWALAQLAEDGGRTMILSAMAEMREREKNDAVVRELLLADQQIRMSHEYT